jgi:RNA polymerase sigma-70 factor (ECF subfamily)
MSERAEFEAWYQREHPRVLGALTVVTGSPDVAADATADAFVRAYERWERVRLMRSPGGWLYTVALNAARRRTRRQALEAEVLRRGRSRAAAPVAIDPDLWEAVRALPPRQRTAVALRYVVDLPEAEIAAAMGVTRGAVSATLTAARRALAARLTTEAPEAQEVPRG